MEAQLRAQPTAKGETPFRPYVGLITDDPLPDALVHA